MSNVETSTDSQKATITDVFHRQKSFSNQLRTEKISERAKRLKKLQIWIEKNQKTIQDAVYKDFKKPALEVSISEIFPVLTEIKHTLSNLSEWSKPKKVDAPLTMLGTTSYVQYEPKGVCLIIAPWNYPFNLTMAPLISALAAGNTAIIKPSEMTPHTAELVDMLIGELFTEEEVRVFNGGVETSQALLELPFDHIFFTGSPAIGKIVMKAAAENLTSVTLELGGKSPTIIDETADTKDAAEKVAWGKFVNNGQTCIAPDYILVHEKAKDSFLKYLKDYIQKQFDHTNEGFKTSEDYARIVNEKHFDRINGLIKDALDRGGDIVMGGDTDKEDRFIPPTILENVPDDAEIMHEEIFGPVLPIKTFTEIDEVISYINSKPKPLALYHFGRNKKSKQAILKQTSSGAVCINDCVIHYGHTELPFGGVNNSGIGKSHGWYGFVSFSNEKAVLKQRVGLTTAKTIYPPYNALVRRMIDFIKYL